MLLPKEHKFTQTQKKKDEENKQKGELYTQRHSTVTGLGDGREKKRKKKTP